MIKLQKSFKTNLSHRSLRKLNDALNNSSTWQTTTMSTCKPKSWWCTRWKKYFAFYKMLSNLQVLTWCIWIYRRSSDGIIVWHWRMHSTLWVNWIIDVTVKWIIHRHLSFRNESICQYDCHCYWLNHISFHFNLVGG